MECKNCEENFRTIHLKAGTPRICYHCKFDNGVVPEDKQGQFQ